MFPTKFYDYLKQRKTVEIKVGPDRDTFTKIWMVEVSGRIFARSWTRSRTGWFGALCQGQSGEVRFGEDVMSIEGTALTEQALMRQIDEAYISTFIQPHNVSYAEGISRLEYHPYTVEILPGDRG